MPPTTRTTLDEEVGDVDDGGEVFDSSVTAAETDTDLWEFDFNFDEKTLEEEGNCCRRGNWGESWDFWVEIGRFQRGEREILEAIDEE